MWWLFCLLGARIKNRERTEIYLIIALCITPKELIVRQTFKNNIYLRM